MNKIGSITLSFLHVLLFALVTTNISAQTTSTSQPVKQIVNGYFFNGSFKNSITKVLLHLEDDFVIGYDNEDGYKPFERKRKIHRNSISNPSKVASDPQMKIGGDYTHHYLDYYIKWGARTVYFNLNKSVTISSEKRYDIVSSHKPMIKTDAYYLDPTWNDVSYRTMVINLCGDRIQAYEDPLTKQFLYCGNSFHKMTSEEKNQMKLYDSQGRSYELYIGDCTHIGKVGKLIVYFRAPNNVNEVFPENDVDKKPMIKLNGHGNGNIDNRINLQDYLQSKFVVDTFNPNPLEDIVLSYIANTDGVISDIKVVKSLDNSIDKDVINALDNISASRIEPALRDNKYVNMQGVLTIRAKRSFTQEQKFDKCKKYFDVYFSDKHRKENIEYAKHRLMLSAESDSILPPNAPKAIQEFAAFINNFSEHLMLYTRFTNVKINGNNRVFNTEVYSGALNNQSSDSKKIAQKRISQWNKIMDKLFESNQGETSVYWHRNNGQKLYLKYAEYENFIQYQLNKLNNKIYNHIIKDNLKKAEIGHHCLPSTFRELSHFFTKEASDEMFEKFWSEAKKDCYNIDLMVFSGNTEYIDLIEQWKQDFYYNQLGENRNAIFYVNSNVIMGCYPEFIEWKNVKVNREFIFDNTRPYMLYLLQDKCDRALIRSEKQWKI